MHRSRVEGARVYAISHGHSDHIGALHHILRVRGQTRASAPKPTILMPECYLKNWMKLFKYSMLMDAGPDGSVLDYKALCNVQAVSNDEVSGGNCPRHDHDIREFACT